MMSHLILSTKGLSKTNIAKNYLKMAKKITGSTKELPKLRTKSLANIGPEMAFKVLSCNSKLFKDHIHTLVKKLTPYEILKLASKSKLNKDQLSNVLVYIFEKFKLQKLDLTLCGRCTIFETKSSERCDWHGRYHKCHLHEDALRIGSKFNTSSFRLL